MIALAVGLLLPGKAPKCHDYRTGQKDSHAGSTSTDGSPDRNTVCAARHRPDVFVALVGLC
jgi:hypothetical protein